MDSSEMVPIPIVDFISGNKAPVDLYVRLSDDKFVCLAKAGADTQKNQLFNYKNKHVQYLWVKKEDYHKVSKQTIAIAGIAVTKALDIEQKSHVVTAAARTIFTELDHIGLSVDTYNNAKQVTEATVHMVDHQPDLNRLFQSLKSCSDDLLRHSMAVSAVSVMIGSEMGWENRTNLEKLALGGLLHDIGKKALPKELLNKSKAEMEFEELQLYETHSYKGMQMVLSLGVVPDDIVSIIYEHHENAIGQGYPQRLRDIKIHPLARVVGLANEFVNLTFANPSCPVAKTPAEALKYIELTMGQPYNRDVFKALKEIVDNRHIEAA